MTPGKIATVSVVAVLATLVALAVAALAVFRIIDDEESAREFEERDGAGDLRRYGLGNFEDRDVAGSL